MLVSVVVALVWILSLAATHMRVVDAARETARVAARSDSRESAIAAGRAVAPSDAQIEIEERGDSLVARVTAKVLGPRGVFALLGSPAVSATATSVREDR